MNNPTILGVCGKARSGKDTFAAYLADTINNTEGCGATILSLADPIKEMVYTLVRPITDEPFYELMTEHKETPLPHIGKSPRELLQTLGTEWGRESVDINLWINLLWNRVAREQEAGVERFKRGGRLLSHVIVPDVRFHNEALSMDCVYKVVREDIPEVAAHSSEGGIADAFVRRVINNSSTLEDLRGEAQAVVDELLQEND